MKTKMLLIYCLFLIACGGEKNKLSGDTPLTAEEIIEVYKELKLPFDVADTAIIRKTDTTHFSYAALSQMIPDSILSKYANTKKGSSIQPMGKITKDDELYLLTTFKQNKQPLLVAFVFDKKNKFLGHLQILNNGMKDGYRHSVSINREPTFFVNRERSVQNQDALYTRNSFAFNKDANGFIIVMRDSNEETAETNSIVNPIDTMPKLNKYSGDYIKDKKNFLSVRDGKNGSNYQFFIYFSKNNGECNGELKGTLTVTSANKAIYSANGDPCVIDFTFKGNSIVVKEQGSCGNHRGIKCYFDDTYTRKKEPAQKSKKKNKKS
jgi:hypothetical protein